MRSFKTWLAEKEWDDTKNPGQRLKAIAVGYNNLESTQRFVDQLNVECKQCPRRAALHTVYRVIEPAVNIRILTADDTYKEKLREQEQQNANQNSGQEVQAIQ